MDFLTISAIIEMHMIEYRKATLSEEEIAQLIQLSVDWVNEGITGGLRSNTKDDLHLPMYLALDNNKIVGYIFGHFYNRETKLWDIEIGTKCFDVEELYIAKDYRSQGIGKKLFELLEEEVKKETEYITLGTSTHDYKKIFHFYIEEVGMSFHSALFLKKI